MDLVLTNHLRTQKEKIRETMKIISRRKNSKEKKLKKNMEEKNIHPNLKKLRIKDFQGNFSKQIWRETKNISRRKKII